MSDRIIRKEKINVIQPGGQTFLDRISTIPQPTIFSTSCKQILHDTAFGYLRPLLGLLCSKRALLLVSRILGIPISEIETGLRASCGQSVIIQKIQSRFVALF